MSARLAGFLLAIAATALPAQASTPATNWRQFTELEKTLYLRGFFDGVVAGQVRILDLANGPNAQRWFLPKVSPGSISFDSATAIVLQRS